jgi:hypothetical protein
LTGFVSELNAAGTALEYSTYLGGSNYDLPNALAIDPDGNAFIAGTTESADFPTVNPFRSYNGGVFGTDANGFITKLNPTGGCVFSSFVGGDNSAAYGVAADALGNAYVAGNADTQGGFVIKVSPDASKVFYSYAAAGSAGAIAVDVAGDAFFAGADTVSELNPAGSDLIYSTTISGGVGILSIAVDAAGDAYVGGEFAGPGFPLVNPIQSDGGGGFITDVAPGGASILFSTFFGSPAVHMAVQGIAIDSENNVYVTGQTQGGIPTAHALYPNPGYTGPAIEWDAFVARIHFPPPPAFITTWTGLSSNVWSDPGNWTNGIPATEA